MNTKINNEGSMMSAELKNNSYFIIQDSELGVAIELATGVNHGK